MKSLILFLLLISSISIASNDKGMLTDPELFTTHCKVKDYGISGNPTIDVYIKQEISCEYIQEIYKNISNQALAYFKQNFTSPWNIPINIRIVSIADLNNPENFGLTDARCMYNLKCQSGVYYGRTFLYQSHISTYIGFIKIGKHNFMNTLKHEIAHIVLYRTGASDYLTEKEEHAIIDRFMKAE